MPPLPPLTPAKAQILPFFVNTPNTDRVKCIGEMSYRTEVKSVKLKGDRIVVVLETKIFLYNFADLKLLEHIDTCPNPLGLCSMNTDGDYTVLACPDKQAGHVNIHHWDKKTITSVKAHQSQLNCIQLNAKGTKLATASEKGTIIRIYNTEKGEQLQELRRGSEYAQIYSIAFDPSGLFLACSSDSGTIHIFGLKLSEEEKKDEQTQSQNQQLQEAKNPKSKFSFMKAIIPYFDSEWSFAQLRILDTKSRVAFGTEPNTIIVITQEGNYYLAAFDPINGGEF